MLMFENENAPLKAYSGYNGKERVRNFKKFIHGLCEMNEDLPEDKKISALKAEMMVFKREKAEEEQNANARKKRSLEKTRMNEVLVAQENRMDLNPPPVLFASAKMPAALPLPLQPLAAISASTSTDVIDVETDDEEVRVLYDDDENLFNEVANTLPVNQKKKGIKKRRIPPSLGSGRRVEDIDRIPSYAGLIHGIASASKNLFDVMVKKNDIVPINHDQTPVNKKTGNLNKLQFMFFICMKYLSILLLLLLKL